MNVWFLVDVYASACYVLPIKRMRFSKLNYTSNMKRETPIQEFHRQRFLIHFHFLYILCSFIYNFFASSNLQFENEKNAKNDWSFSYITCLHLMLLQNHKPQYQAYHNDNSVPA